MERGYDVHVLADGVSSCNKEEIPFAFARMRQAGVQVTTSESAAYQLMCTSMFRKQCLVANDRDLRSGCCTSYVPTICTDHQGGERDYEECHADVVGGYEMK